MKLLELNRLALAQLRCREKQIVVVPAATHLFEEPATLEGVARLAADWFSCHLTDTKSEVEESNSDRDRQHPPR